MPAAPTAFISLGSNVGDRERTLARAVEALEDTDTSQVLLYEPHLSRR